MSVVEQLQSTAVNVEGVREGLERMREALERSESVLIIADDVLAVTDDILESAADALEKSKRWAPRVAIVVGVVAIAAIGVVVITRLRKRDED